MYESFYGLEEKPFAPTPDPQFLYLAPPHRKALTILEYSLASEGAFCLITGEVGSGKTTLIRRLLQGIEQSITVGLISNTSLHFGRLLQWICLSFGLEHSGKDKVALHELFTRFLQVSFAWPTRRGSRVSEPSRRYLACSSPEAADAWVRCQSPLFHPVPCAQTG